MLATSLALAFGLQRARADDAVRVHAPGSCRTPDVVTIAHLTYLRQSSSSASAQDSAWRVHLNVPRIADTTNRIVVVSDSTLCTRALAAYNVAAALTDSAATEIELLQADTVFVASHPSIRSGEFVMSYVFDHAFNFLGSYLQ
jgi:hypothetical protein